MSENRRHILGLSGGKDSSALAIYMRDKLPEMERAFCNTKRKSDRRIEGEIEPQNSDEGLLWLDLHDCVIIFPVVSGLATKSLNIRSGVVVGGMA